MKTDTIIIIAHIKIIANTKNQYETISIIIFSFIKSRHLRLEVYYLNELIYYGHLTNTEASIIICQRVGI